MLALVLKVRRHSLPEWPRLSLLVVALRNGVVGLGVADGVYMWKTQGIDAGLYSRTLMTAARSAVEGGNGDALAGARPGSWLLMCL